VSQTRKHADVTAEIRSTPMNGHCQTGPTGPFRVMNGRQPTPGAGQSRATAPWLGKPGKVALDGTASQEAVLAVRRSAQDAQKLQAAQAPAVTNS
jgi:hypothetical protein